MQYHFIYPSLSNYFIIYVVRKSNWISLQKQRNEQNVSFFPRNNNKSLLKSKVDFEYKSSGWKSVSGDLFICDNDDL